MAKQVPRFSPSGGGFSFTSGGQAYVTPSGQVIQGINYSAIGGGGSGTSIPASFEDPLILAQRRRLIAARQRLETLKQTSATIAQAPSVPAKLKTPLPKFSRTVESFAAVPAIALSRERQNIQRQTKQLEETQSKIIEYESKVGTYNEKVSKLQNDIDSAIRSGGLTQEQADALNERIAIANERATALERERAFLEKQQSDRIENVRQAINKAKRAEIRLKTVSGERTEMVRTTPTPSPLELKTKTPLPSTPLDVKAVRPQPTGELSPEEKRRFALDLKEVGREVVEAIKGVKEFVGGTFETGISKIPFKPGIQKEKVAYGAGEVFGTQAAVITAVPIAIATGAGSIFRRVSYNLGFGPVSSELIGLGFEFGTIPKAEKTFLRFVTPVEQSARRFGGRLARQGERGLLSLEKDLSKTFRLIEFEKLKKPSLTPERISFAVGEFPKRLPAPKTRIKVEPSKPLFPELGPYIRIVEKPTGKKPVKVIPKSFVVRPEELDLALKAKRLPSLEGFLKKPVSRKQELLEKKFFETRERLLKKEKLSKQEKELETLAQRIAKQQDNYFQYPKPRPGKRVGGQTITIQKPKIEVSKPLTKTRVRVRTFSVPGSAEQLAEQLRLIRLRQLKRRRRFALEEEPIQGFGFAPAIKSGLGTATILGQEFKVSPELKVSEKKKLKPFNIFEEFSLKQFQQPVSISRVTPIQAQAFGFRFGVAIPSLSVTVPKPVERTFQRSRQQQEPVPRPVRRNRFDLEPFRPKEKKKPLLLQPKKRFLNVQPIAPSLQKGYRVLVKRRGKYRVVGDLLPKGKALRLGVLVTAGTAARTFQLIQKGLTRTPDIRFQVPSNMFRRQIRKGKPVGRAFVERTKFAIDMPGEFREITFAPRRKPRRKRKR